jgi:hypothetical protein
VAQEFVPQMCRVKARFFGWAVLDKDKGRFGRMDNRAPRARVMRCVSAIERVPRVSHEDFPTGTPLRNSDGRVKRMRRVRGGDSRPSLGRFCVCCFVA